VFPFLVCQSRVRLLVSLVFEACVVVQAPSGKCLPGLGPIRRWRPLRGRGI